MANDLFSRVSERKGIKYSANNTKNATSRSLSKNNDVYHNASVSQAPEAKWIKVYINGDEHFSGYRCVINSKYFRSFDFFLNYLTERLQPSFGAVRNIYTPINGHSVHCLEDLRPNQKYVVAGSERFKKLEPGYADIGEKNVKRVLFLPKTKYRVLKAKPQCHYNLTIYLFKNGNYKVKPCKLALYNQDLESWNALYQKVSETLKCGAIKRICSLSGKPIKSIIDLVNNQAYVVIGKHEVFKNGSYCNSSCMYSTSREISSYSKQPRKSSSLIYSRSSAQSRSSMTIGVSLLSPANGRTSVLSSSNFSSSKLSNHEFNNFINKAENIRPRKVQSYTGSIKKKLEEVAVQEQIVPEVNGKSDTNISRQQKYNSVDHNEHNFDDDDDFAFKVNELNQYDKDNNNFCSEDFINKIKQVDLDDDFSGIYRAKSPNFLTFGALEIDDDIETAVNLPIDLLEAEEAEEEEIPEIRTPIQHLNLDVSDKVVSFLPHVKKDQSAENERNISSKNYNLSGSQAIDMPNIYV